MATSTDKAALRRIVNNTSKLVDRIQTEINKELKNKVKTLLKGIASELNTTLKGKSLSLLSDLPPTTSTYDNIRVDNQDIIDSPYDDDVKIRKIMWDGECYINNERYDVEFLVFHTGDDEPISLVFIISMEVGYFNIGAY